MSQVERKDIEKFRAFYRRYYEDAIAKLAQRYPTEQRSLYVAYDDLFTYDAELAQRYLDRPVDMQEIAEEALRTYDLPADVSLGQAHVRVRGLPASSTIDIRNIRVVDDHIGSMVAVQGIVRKATDVRPKIVEAAFECQRCGTMTYIPQSDSGFQEPHECQGCERQGPFRINNDQSEFIDAQTIRVQESPEGLRGGETPQSIDVYLEDDVCGEVTPGDHVSVAGVLHIEQQVSGNEKTALFDLYMDGVAVTIEDEEFEDMEISDEDVTEILELADSPNIYERMVDSVAPSIYGYDQEKLAMILQLFGGVTKHLPDESRIRGDLHMLLIGDPGTGKCVRGDTRVTLADGSTAPIRELVETNLTDPTPVDDGVYDSAAFAVPSLSGDGRLVTRRATRVWRRDAPEHLLCVETSGGREIEVTPSHPLFVRENEAVSPRRAEEVEPGAVVAIAGAETVADGGSRVGAASADGESRVGAATVADEGSRVGAATVADGGSRVGTATVTDEGGCVGEGVGYERVVSVERVDHDERWVYDLEVAGTHSYVSNGIVSHNSQLLSYIQNIAPRSVYTSGKGSSSAGLTAAAVQDDFGDGQQWTLEAGALVLADKGVAAIDELDKMDSNDRSAMHEALEQQSYHPDEEILLADGRRVEIGEFVDRAMNRRADDVVDGVDCEILSLDDTRIHSVDMETNEVTKRPVDRVSRHEAPDEFVRVAFSNGRSVTVTPDHPMFVDDGGVETVTASSVEEGDFVPAPRVLPNSTTSVPLSPTEQAEGEKIVQLPEEMSPNLAEILGFLTAEGHSYAGSAHGIGFSNQDERLLARMDSLFQRVFGIESTDTTNAAGTVTKRWISTKLYRWFQSNFPEVMQTARNKRVPAAVLGASTEEVRRYLVGAFAGDGSVESESMALSTASSGLAEDYADALAKLGVATRLHHDPAEDSWKTYVTGDSIPEFVDAVVEPTDDRYQDAVDFAERSERTPRHHDVLPPSAAEEIRDLRRRLGLGLTGQLKPNIDEGFGVRIETVEEQVATLRRRVSNISDRLHEADSLEELRDLVGWSGRQLAERLDSETTSAVHYAENGGYDAERRQSLLDRSVTAVREALDSATTRLAALEDRCELRYYEVTEVEIVPNEGEHATEWVYDVTVEPTNTFVSDGVVLHNSISISKAGINATLRSRCSLLGAANPKYGRFDQYEPIGEQIDLEPALISRFDLIFTVTDQPDPDEDARLAEHILTTNYAGELNTQQTEMTNSEVSRQQVEEVQETVAPAVDAELLRKYVAYAKRNCYPRMTDAAREAIRDFYVDLRSKGLDEDSPVPVTARQLEAIVRLAEASARVRLSDEVTAADAERVIEIVRSCLEDIGIDPETGEFDADVVETGTTKSQRDRIKGVKELLRTVDEEYEDEPGAPRDQVMKRADEEGMERSKVEKEIERLREKGDVYTPDGDHIKLV